MKIIDDHFDVIVIGSGFGGSVMACRVAEAGLKVLVIEQGRRFSDSQFAKTSWNIRKYLWAPLMGCFGILSLRLFKHVFVLHGVGVGGGSLGYATVLMEPQDSFFKAGLWSQIKNWKSELMPHFSRAKKMLGVAKFPHRTTADETLDQVAKSLNLAHQSAPTDVGIYFGNSDHKEIDPYFAGTGPSRSACTLCGACMTGCRVGAKNTLVKNYLYFAERHGAKILADHKVKNIVPTQNGFTVEVSRVPFRNVGKMVFSANKVVVAAGVLGSLELLLRCRDKTKSLPNLSQTLGTEVRTNGEAILAVTAPIQNSSDFSYGVAITSRLQLDEHTKIEPVRFGKKSNLMRFLTISASDGIRGNGLFAFFIGFLKNLFVRRWSERTTLLLAMQTNETKLRLNQKQGFFEPLKSAIDDDNPAPSARIPEALQAAKSFAKLIQGKLFLSFSDIFFKIPTTAHILGGCPIGTSSESGVVDEKLQVHGYPGLYVVDGSVLSGNLGANPSLTITAFAEYAASHFLAEHFHSR